METEVPGKSVKKRKKGWGVASQKKEWMRRGKKKRNCQGEKGVNSVKGKGTRQWTVSPGRGIGAIGGREVRPEVILKMGFVWCGVTN